MSRAKGRFLQTPLLRDLLLIAFLNTASSCLIQLQVEKICGPPRDVCVNFFSPTKHFHNDIMKYSLMGDQRAFKLTVLCA